MLNELEVNMRKRTFILMAFFAAIIACKKPAQNTVPETSNQNEILVAEEKPNLFFNSNDIAAIPLEKVYFSNKNDVILFRPSENEFGLLLEDTQDTAWLSVDDKFETLTNMLKNAFKDRKEFKISTIEKPMIAVTSITDTLFFDAAKQRYGLILCSQNSEPVFIPHDAPNVITLIKSHFNL